MSEVSTSWSQVECRLGYELTGAQSRVVAEVAADLARSVPSLRLVQGDVGSGKTVVALAAALQAIDAGYQTALMAPTELLAEQHRRSFTTWFETLDYSVEWLSGKLTAPQRLKALTRIQSGDAQMVVGTHALFQEDVDFDRLGLIIVDEQHRFGVDQRLALRNKGQNEELVPHQLIMSATPIPRSMAMIFYADLDVSSIDELPPGRQEVTTVALPDSRADELIARISDVCNGGHQAYWVCPIIEESEKLQVQAASSRFEDLAKQLPQLNIELIHGRLKSREKDDIMRRFRDGEIDVLVATTVIEVGVDVPNANLMIIENAERLGLAQLHQLRGRVGRGHAKANCVLMYQSPLGRMAKDRLSLLRETSDGFEIARKDLELRGPGELLGTRQTGLQQMKVADLSRDQDLLSRIEEIAQAIRQEPDVCQSLIDRWISQRESYAQV